MGEKKYRYLSFLLRIWEVQHNGETVWRASLECPGSRERFGFESVEKLFAFLLSQTEPKTMIIEMGPTAVEAAAPGSLPQGSTVAGGMQETDTKARAATLEEVTGLDQEAANQPEQTEEFTQETAENAVSEGYTEGGKAAKPRYRVPPISKYEGG